MRYNSASSQKQQQTPPKNVGFEETLRDRYTVGVRYLLYYFT